MSDDTYDDTPSPFDASLGEAPKSPMLPSRFR